MAEPTVQVPVSLIKQIERDLGENAWHPEDCPGSHPAHCTCAVGQARRALRALLSQPTAEPSFPDAYPEGRYGGPSVQSGILPHAVLVEPPRIEDMAPGTQAATARPDGDAFGRFVDSFNGDEAGDIEFMSALDGRVGYAMVGGNDLRAVFEHAIQAIDPSTIRDVTPPAGD